MAIKDYSVPTQTIRHSGIFDFPGLLTAIKDWFTDKNYKFHEPKRKYKEAQEGVNQEIEFYGEIDYSEYVQFRIDVIMFVFELKSVEVVKEGQKLLMSSARVTADVSGKIKFDPKKRFGKGKTMPTIQDFYHRFVLKKPLEKIWEKELFMQVLELAKIIKENLNQELV